MGDRELLREYVEQGSEQAFALLVERHINMVYATALRLVREAHLAQDVSQAVFIELARKARVIRDGNALSGWLYRTACRVAANAVRTERRRRQRENEAVNRDEVHVDTANAPSVVAPLLDEAMQRLNEAEQNVVVLRFFEGKTLREVGLALAITEDAAQKRISRALDKLRTHLNRRGIAISSAAMFGALASQSVQAAPAGLASTLAGASLAGASSAGSAGLTTIVETFLMTKAKATIVTAVVVVAAGTAVFESQQASTLQKEIQRLQLQHAQEIQRLKENAATRASNASVAVAEKAPLTAAEIEARIQAIARPGNWRKWSEWDDFVRSLAPRDMQKALAAVEKIAEQQVRDHFRSRLLERWAKTDPTAALAYAQSITRDLAQNWAVCNVLRAWANDDPPSARAWVQQLPKGPLRRAALNAIVEASVGENPQATCDLLDSLVDGWATAHTDIMFEVWARTDPAAAMVKALEIPVEDTRRVSAISSIVSMWARVDAKAAMDWVEALPAGSQRETLRQGLLRNVVTSWASSEPKRAVEYVLNLPSGPHREELLKDAVRTWANTDPKAVFAWGQSLPDDSARQEAIGTALIQLAEHSPQDALTAAQSLPAEERNGKLTLLGRILKEADVDALQHASRFAEEADRNSYVLGVAQATWQSAPSIAAQLVAALPSSKTRDNLVHLIAGTWAQTDPAAAAAWVGSFPEGEVREHALVELAYKWTRQDQAGVLDWLQSLPKDQAWEGALVGYIARVSERTPEQAAPLAETVTNPARRHILIEKVARNWMKKDREAAAAWLEQTTLPGDRQFRLLQGW